MPIKNLPKHIAIIMDGNGRWATQRGLPRSAGHKKGVSALKNIVKVCAKYRIEVLTVFAFSSENWQRPKQEVQILMDLFLSSLKSEVDALHKNNVVLKFIGNREEFPVKLNEMISQTEKQTALNNGLKLFVAANYGGRWDILQAGKRLAEEVDAGNLQVDEINEEKFSCYLSLHGQLEPDLFIRTGGEQRISNFLLWQCAYSELFFCDDLWPEFSEHHLRQALDWYAGRQRRFGKSSEQIDIS
jgi:undecaprenyl diphosphate synthase